MASKKKDNKDEKGTETPIRTGRTGIWRKVSHKEKRGLKTYKEVPEGPKKPSVSPSVETIEDFKAINPQKKQRGSTR